jgi:hypothetical protein
MMIPDRGHRRLRNHVQIRQIERDNEKKRHRAPVTPRSFSRRSRNLDQALAVFDVHPAGGGKPTERRRPMAVKPTFPRNRKMPSRNPERYRFRAFDDFGDELLDDWMVASPAADLARSD